MTMLPSADAMITFGALAESHPLSSMYRTCAACHGTGQRTEETEEGQYRSQSCQACEGQGRMTLRQLRAWLDEQAERTPSAELSEEEIRGLFAKS